MSTSVSPATSRNGKWALLVALAVAVPLLCAPAGDGESGTDAGSGGSSGMGGASGSGGATGTGARRTAAAVMAPAPVAPEPAGRQRPAAHPAAVARAGAAARRAAAVTARAAGPRPVGRPAGAGARADAPRRDGRAGRARGDRRPGGHRQRRRDGKRWSDGLGRRGRQRRRRGGTSTLCPPGITQTITVAKDGSGQFTTVQAAVNSIASGSSAHIRIDIKAGTYTEKLTIASRTNLCLVGAGTTSTILSYGDSNATRRQHQRQRQRPRSARTIFRPRT